MRSFFGERSTGCDVRHMASGKPLGRLLEPISLLLQDLSLLSPATLTLPMSVAAIQILST